jgi:arsenate reductase-like glutaredoxin family protein
VLHQILEKLGLTFDRLTNEEKKTYQQWSEILGSKDVTLEDVKKLVTSEHQRAHDELLKYDNSIQRQLFFQALARLTETLDKFISAPSQRDALKTHLKEVFHIDI